MHYALVQFGAVIDTRNVAPGQSPPPAPVGCQWVADPRGGSTAVGNATFYLHYAVDVRIIGG